MGTRVSSCVRVRSRAGADDAPIRGMCASAARALRTAIDGTRTEIVYIYTMHACIYIHARLATRTNGSPMRVRRADASTCCVRERVRVRVRFGAHASAPTHASAFRRRRPRAARLAGVQLGVGVQREHRRLEHRVGHHVAWGMRRPCLGGAPRQDALGGSLVRRGPLCAAAPPMRAGRFGCPRV
jgi:hypothetical protein